MSSDDQSQTVREQATAKLFAGVKEGKDITRYVLNGPNPHALEDMGAADPHARDEHGNSALDYATGCDPEKISYNIGNILALVKAGANPDEKGANGKSPMDNIKFQITEGVRDHASKKFMDEVYKIAREDGSKVSKEGAAALEDSKTPHANYQRLGESAMEDLVLVAAERQKYLDKQQKKAPAQAIPSDVMEAALEVLHHRDPVAGKVTK